jgi:DNA-binding SARP family transcriptional activator/WD40 repeat protein
MRIAVLGPLEVRDDGGAPVEIPGAKERLLLAVLAADAGRVVSTDRITEALWNGDAPPSARKSLQAHLVRLRTALEPGRPRGSTGRYVVRRGTGYALALEREGLDALRFAELAALGRARLGTGEADEAARVLTQAAALWRGEPYADWPDADFATAERRRLIEVRAGAVGALLEARLADGEHAAVVPELERLVVEEPLREDWWRLLVLALYRSGRQADALAAGRRARAVLAEELGADPGPALRDMEAAVLAQDPGLDAPRPRTARLAPVPPPPADSSGRCPYLGLAAYQPADAGLFHGRRRLVGQLVARLVDLPFLVVTGPSGAGKSSVVRAGLVPALSAGAIGDSAAWRPVVLTPGRAPIDALSPLTGEDPPDVPVLLVCDQLEELWAPGVDEGERRTFLDTVLGLLDDGIVARCVAVVRGDHVGRLAEHGGLVERLAGAVVLVPPLSDPELREVVREPAAAVGMTVEPELLDAVAADVLGRAGALPLLSTALVGTWERRRGQLLTLAGYLEAGGVSGALTRSAETAYGSLDERGQEAARRLLIRLADVDEQGALVRRRVLLAELDPGDTAVRDVVETFVARRLLSVDGSSVEVTHEALLSGWPRLARWLEDDATGRSVRRHLAPAALEWDERGRPPDELYRGARLTGALDWASRADADLTPVERQFLDAARSQAEAELDEARRRADREARGRRRSRRLAVGLAVGMVVALVATGLAVRSTRDAQDASRRADGARLATLATTTGTADVSLLLGVEAVRLADVPETRNALLGELVGRGRMARTAPLPDRALQVVAGGDGVVFLPTEAATTLAWSATTGEVRRLTEVSEVWRGSLGWDASAREPLLLGVGVTRFDGPWMGIRARDGSVRPLGNGIDGWPGDAAFTEAGDRVVALVTDEAPFGPVDGSLTWRLVEVDVSDGGARDLGIAGSVPGAERVWVEVSHGARWALVGSLSPEPRATLVEVDGGTRHPLRIPARSAATDGFRTLPSGVAQLWSDGEVTLFDADGAVRQQLDAVGSRVTDVVEGPDGTWAATVGTDGVITLWDVDPGSGLWASPERWVGHGGDVVDADVDPAGERLLTVGRDDRVIAWDVTRTGGFGTDVEGWAGRTATAPPEVVRAGRLAVAATVPAGVEIGNRGPDLREPVPVSATFFDPVSGRVVAEVPVGNALPGGAVPSLAVSPDGRTVAVSTGSAVTVLDAVDRRELSTYAAPSVTIDAGAPAAGYVPCLTWTRAPARLLACVLDVHQPILAEIDPLTGEQVARTLLSEGTYAVATSPDGDLIAAGGGAGDIGSLVLMDATTLEVEQFVSYPRRDVPTDVSFSPDGRRIALTDRSGLVVVDTRSWKAAPAPPPLIGPLLQAEWFPDSRTVAVAGTDRRAHLYDVEQGQARSLPLPASQDGGGGDVHLVPGISDELVVLGGAQRGRRYPLDPATWSARACTMAGRSLTEAEWARYMPDRPYRPACTEPG